MNVFFFIGLTSLFGRSGLFVFLRNENLEVRRTLRARIYRPVGKDEGRAWRDNRLCLIQEGSWKTAFLRSQKNTLTRFVRPGRCHFRPTHMSVRPALDVNPFEC